jgi:hypothetical protein
MQNKVLFSGSTVLDHIHYHLFNWEGGVFEGDTDDHMGRTFCDALLVEDEPAMALGHNL